MADARSSINRKPNVVPKPKPPAVKPKPSGTKVRAFIESLENSKKPQPDFFDSKGCSFLQENTKAANLSKDSQSLRSDLNSSTQKCVSDSPCDRNSEEHRSDDSGHSTYDLKYTGSTSSTQSSSYGHSPKALSETDHYDEGFSEHTYSKPLNTLSELGSLSFRDSYVEGSGTCLLNTNDGSWQVVRPGSPDPDDDYVEVADQPRVPKDQTEGGKKHHAAYKYHVPSKYGGTLPRTLSRDKKDAAAIGKAVARGRHALRRKSPQEQIISESTSTAREEHCITDAAPDAKENTLKTSHEDSTYAEAFTVGGNETDSSWETDTENGVSDIYTDSQGVASSYADSINPTRQSELHYQEPDSTNSLARLLRGNSLKKDTHSRFKKRISNIKININQLKDAAANRIAGSSFIQQTKVQKLITIFKKPKSPKEPPQQPPKDYFTEASFQEETNQSPHRKNKQTSFSSQHDAMNEINQLSISSLNSMDFVARQTHNNDSRRRARSMGAELGPPLPPRSPRTSIGSAGIFVDEAPPPPPRTSSLSFRAVMTSASQTSSVPVSGGAQLQSGDNTTATAQSPLKHTHSVSNSPKPQAAPRLGVGRQNVLGQSHSSASAPDFATLSAPSPILPPRINSSRSCLVPSHDDLIRPRSEIVNPASRTPSAIITSRAQLSLELIEDSGEDSTDGSTVESLENEPLYQTYQECVQSSRALTFNRVATLLRSGGPMSTLWSNTHRVRHSGCLEKMAPEEIKLQEAMYEVVTSEASYLRSLTVLVNVFVESELFANEEILPARDRKTLFSNVATVKDVSARLFAELDAHWKQSIILTSVPEIVSRFTLKEFDCYIKYCSNQAYQDRTLKTLCQNREFCDALAQLEKRKECQGLAMSSFLLLPMQRITRLPLLIDAICRRVDMSSEPGTSAFSCYEQLKKVVKKCNEGARKMEETEQVLNIENKLLFRKIKKVALVSSTRQLIKSGALTYLCTDATRTTASKISVRLKSLSLFLFNDLLLITKKKGENFLVLDYAPRLKVDTVQFSTSQDHRLATAVTKGRFMFTVVLLENHLRKHAEYLLSCKNETDRMRWMEAICPPSTEDAGGDKIYESWDCPQVEVLHKYVAQEPDELDLEAGEIINILRKTPDGWYEGERVSDGRTGWLPSLHAVELDNDHVRARHLKERYKLLQAAAKYRPSNEGVTPGKHKHKGTASNK